MSNHELAVGANAQQALVRVLAKAKLIDATVATKPFTSSDFCPIAHFAQQGKWSEEEAIQTVAEQLGLSVFKVNKTNVERLILFLDDSRINKVSMATWSKLRAMPIAFSNPQLLTIAMANPLDNEARNSLEFELGVMVEVGIASEHDILKVLGKQLSTNQGLTLNSIFEQASPSAVTANGPQASFESSVVTDDPDSPAVIRLVNKILADAVEHGASDIHIEPEKQEVHVRIRVDGIMRTLFKAPIDFNHPTISRIKLLAGMDIAERRKPQDGRFRIKTARGMKDLRVATAPTVHGETIVIRILSSDLGKLEFEALGMNPDILGRYQQLLHGSSRVVLVTGPTGSGKTSTLYTGLSSLADGKRTIVTIEDPIEYRMEGASQIQVNPKIGLTFAEGLRSIVRQDPDVVMVGEIRDAETAGIAMQVAQTGHLVLSTLHTNTASSAITRLRDLGVPTFIIASSLGGVIAQRLVRKLCTRCAVPADAATVQKLEALHAPPGTPKNAKGCGECGGSGYSGRIGIFSLLEINEEIREAIRQGKSEWEIEAIAARSGFTPLSGSAINLVNSGVTTIQEVERILGPLTAEGMHAGSTVSASIKEQPSSGLDRRRVLLVEDDENTRSVLSLLLQHELYDVVEAANGIEGLEQVHQSIPDLIVCDLMMPKMNGSQFVQRLRSDSRLRDIPVLMLTAANTEENEVQLISMGADDFVAKNGDTRVLLARVQRLLSRAQLDG